MQDKPKLIFLAGINGAGKSTLAEDIKEISDNTIIINPDEISRKYQENHQDIANLKGARETLKLFKSAIANKQDVVLETTLSGHSVFKRYEHAKNNGYHITTMYVGLDSVERHIQRVADRVKNGGHDIPKDLIEKRYSERENQLLKAFAKSDSFIAYDNSEFNRIMAFSYQKENHSTLEVYSNKTWVRDVTKKIAEQYQLIITNLP